MKAFDEEKLKQDLSDPKRQRKAFEEMVNHMSPYLYTQIRRMVLYHEDTDDILQNTFLKAWANLSSFRGDSKISTWLYRIAYNETLAFLDKQKNNIPIDTPEATATINRLMADDYFDGDAEEAHFMTAIQTLPPKQRQVFCMKYFEEMKYETISELLGITVGGLKASYHLAVEKIKKYLSKED